MAIKIAYAVKIEQTDADAIIPGLRQTIRKGVISLSVEEKT
jgi:uncharacterized protein YihD (DUF1040 family)